LRTRPAAFVPVRGKWGEGGATNVRLRTATKKDVREAMTLAWENHVRRQR
jgi:hypothetical protein